MIVFLFAEDGQTVQLKEYVEGQGVSEEQCFVEDVPSKIKALAKSHRVGKGQPFKVVLPEAWLDRQILSLPKVATPLQEKGMLAAYLNEQYGQQWLCQWRCIDREEGLYSLCHCDNDAWQSVKQVLPSHQDHYEIIAAGEWIFRHCKEALADGYWATNEMLFAIKDHQLIDVAFSLDAPLPLLYEQMVVRHHRQTLHLENVHQWSPLPTTPSVREGAWEGVVFQENSSASFRKDKKMIALSLLCVVLPLLLLIVLHGYAEQGVQSDTVAQSQASPSIAVKRSHYSDLLEVAYRSASPRITLEQHEASEDRLKMKGHCQEVLDVAAYMQAIVQEEATVTPILTELIEVREKNEKPYYKFTLALSKDGGAHS